MSQFWSALISLVFRLSVQFWTNRLVTPTWARLLVCPGPLWRARFSISENYAAFLCNRNIEKTPLCKVDVTLPGVRGASGVRDDGGVDEQKGIRPARGLAGRSVWSSAYRGRLRVTPSEAAPGLSSAGWFETRRRGQPGLEAARPAEQ